MAALLIVDDSWLFLEAARDRLEREGLRVVGVAATSAEALRRAEELRPEVVLVDVALGVRAGLSLPGGWPHTTGMAGRRSF
jgi:DNA-binding NarL/FixJ family response regulator